jgi:hypothetical protein
MKRRWRRMRNEQIENGRLVEGLRKVLSKKKPKRIKLSPDTIMEILENADPSEIGIIEMDMNDSGEISKYISFNGVPMILSIKMSHRQHRVALT